MPTIVSDLVIGRFFSGDSAEAIFFDLRLAEDAEAAGGFFFAFIFFSLSIDCPRPFYLVCICPSQVAVIIHLLIKEVKHFFILAP